MYACVNKWTSEKKKQKSWESDDFVQGDPGSEPGGHKAEEASSLSL